MTEAEAITMVQKHVTELGEFFDSVHIFVTMPTENDSQVTRAVDQGCGNWYAKYGQILEWLEIQQEYHRLFARKRNEEEGTK